MEEVIDRTHKMFVFGYLNCCVYCLRRFRISNRPLLIGSLLETMLESAIVSYTLVIDESSLAMHSLVEIRDSTLFLSSELSTEISLILYFVLFLPIVGALDND